MIEIDANEKILRVVRKHWFVFVGDIVVLLFAIALPAIVLYVLNYIPVKAILVFAGSQEAAEFFFLSAWLLIVWMIGWSLWSNYYLDVLIITEKRVFTVEQIGFFRRVSSSFRIDRMQNTTIHQHGIIQTLLGFGTIRLETAGEGEDFIAPYIAKPYDLKKFLNELHDAALEKSQPVHMSEAPKPSAPASPSAPQ